MKKIFAGFLALVLTFGLCACGFGGESANPTDTIDSAPKSEEPGQVAPIDLANPDIIINYGDIDATMNLAGDMSGSKVKENTVIRITGDLFRTARWCVGQKNSETGGMNGIVMVLDSENNLPAEGSKIEVTGVAVKGDWYTEFHVKAENIKLVD